MRDKERKKERKRERGAPLPPFSVLQSRDDALGRFSQSVGDEAPKRDTRAVTLRYVVPSRGRTRTNETEERINERIHYTYSTLV